ncbi:hypothetical protein TEA_015082 [Camellia sinensis var. sinensis]|uniref:Uncharacterized protein n=1 Tax=Camellia sinensis var. sinensis TaxID=542762 RepID=A0A4S4DZ98_CAMSN|nr:hypothetical protein TEA_015082 [Camellia sinensis var. sinensis]
MASPRSLTLFPDLNDPINSSGSRSSTPTASLPNLPVLSIEQIMAAQSDIEANHFTLRSCTETVAAVTNLSLRLQARTSEVEEQRGVNVLSGLGSTEAELSRDAQDRGKKKRTAEETQKLFVASYESMVRSGKAWSSLAAIVKAEKSSIMEEELLKSDIENLNSGKLNKISLAAKWCPTIDSSYDKSTLICESIAKKLFPRNSDPQFEGLEEGHYVYRIRDKLRKQEYLERVTSKKVKIAVGALLPHKIIAALSDGDGGEVAELQWKRMVDDLMKKGKLSNCITVCDVSGSMKGIPMEKVFDRILKVAVEGKLREEQLIKRVFVFSDMEFDVVCESPWEIDYQAIKRKFGEKGYENMPEIVFWNLRSSRSTPVVARQSGVALVSGFSKNLLTMFLEGGGM